MFEHRRYNKKDSEEINKIIGKTVSDITLLDSMSAIEIEFTDGSVIRTDSELGENYGEEREAITIVSANVKDEGLASASSSPSPCSAIITVELPDGKKSEIPFKFNHKYECNTGLLIYGIEKAIKELGVDVDINLTLSSPDLYTRLHLYEKGIPQQESQTPHRH